MPVDKELYVAQPQAAHELPRDLDYLSIHGRVGVAQCLDAELVVLAEAAGLGPLVAEDGAEVVHPDRLGKVMHAVL